MRGLRSRDVGPRASGAFSALGDAVELVAYVALTALVTFLAERPLLAEVRGHLRSRPTVRLPAAGPSAP